MLKQTKIALLVGTLMAGAAFANTATTAVNEPLAREAGARHGEGAGHPAIEVKVQLARNGADDRQPDDRGGRRGGRGGRG